MKRFALVTCVLAITACSEKKGESMPAASQPAAHAGDMMAAPGAAHAGDMMPRSQSAGGRESMAPAGAAPSGDMMHTKMVDDMKDAVKKDAKKP